MSLPPSTPSLLSSLLSNWADLGSQSKSSCSGVFKKRGRVMWRLPNNVIIDVASVSVTADDRKAQEVEI